MINNMNSFNNIDNNKIEEDYFPGNNKQRYVIVFQLNTRLKKLLKLCNYKNFLINIFYLYQV